MSLVNRQVLLRRRPHGLVVPDDTELVSSPAPEPADGEALVRITYVGVDAAARTWLDDQLGYLPPVQLGEVVRAAGIGEVVSSRCDAYAVGDVVTMLCGFQDYTIVRDDVFCTPVTGMDVIDHPAVLSIYGPTGATAYFGMNDVGRPKEGETVVVSAAAGATGSVAGQIAKIAGARVVGIAGGSDKCRAVVEDFGFDACIDYRAGNLDAELKLHCPRGVDVYFDNVGGEILDSVLGRIATNARIVLCGVISSYLTGEHPGPANYVNLLSRTATMQGFNALTEWGRFDEAFAALRRWDAEGRLVHRETVYDGIESCVDALNGIFTGANIGKMMVRIAEPSVSASTSVGTRAGPQDDRVTDQLTNQASGGVIHQHPLAYLLGLEGVALMRAFAGEHDRAFTEARIAEVRRLLDRADELGPGVDVAPLPVADGYDGWATTYDGEDNGCFPMRDEALTPLLDGLTPGRALDAACGTGAVAQQLVDRGHDVVGVDFSEGMLARARKAVPGASFLVGDLTDLPLPDGDVDHVVCSLALAHLSDLRPFFAEAARVMRPGGHLVLLDTRGHFTASPRYPLIQESPDGRVGYVAGFSHGLGDYLRAALPHGYVVRSCEETYRDAHTVGPDEPPEPLTPGPPDIWELHPWVKDAANAAKAGQPAVVAWDFELRPGV